MSPFSSHSEQRNYPSRMCIDSIVKEGNRFILSTTPGESLEMDRVIILREVTQKFGK